MSHFDPASPHNVDFATMHENVMEKLLRRAFFILTLLGLYLQLSIGLPYGVYLVGGLMLAAVSYRGGEPYRPMIFFIFFAIFFLAVTAATHPQDFANQTRSTILLWLTVFASLTLAAMMDRLGPDRIGRWFWWLSVIILAMAVLERAGPLRPISDAVRAMIYDSKILYDAEVRDVRDYGFVRPKVFTSEPSHVAKFLATFLIVSAALSAQRVKHMVAGVFGYLVIGSPAMLITVPVVILIIMHANGWRKSFRSPIVMGGSLLMSGVVLYYIYELATFRLGLGGGVIEPSAYIRLAQPYFIMISALAERPFLGFGLGGEELLETQFLDAATRADAPEYIRTTFYTSLRTLGNVHFAAPTQFGILGTIAWLMGINAMRRFFGASAMLFWSFYFVYGYFIAAVHAPLLWGPMVMVAWALGYCRNGDEPPDAPALAEGPEPEILDETPENPSEIRPEFRAGTRD